MLLLFDKFNYNQMKKGFTLIELLIVVAIIGILAVALVPTITDAPARARDAGRKATVNSVVTAIEAFNLDNGRYPNGTFCIGGTDTATATDEAGLITVLGGAAPSSSLVDDPSNVDSCNQGGVSLVRYEKLSGGGYQVYMPLEKSGNFGVATTVDTDNNTANGAALAASDGAGGTNLDVFAIVRGS